MSGELGDEIVLLFMMTNSPGMYWNELKHNLNLKINWTSPPFLKCTWKFTKYFCRGMVFEYSYSSSENKYLVENCFLKLK